MGALPVVFLRTANLELVEASAWYENKRAGLGREFLEEIERCVNQASLNPLLWAEVRPNMRRVVAKRFPYSVLYRAEPDRIVVLAVFHARRNPTVLVSRVRGEI